LYSCKSLIRKFLPPEISFLYRVIRNGRLKKYITGIKQFKNDKGYVVSDLPLYLSAVAIVKNETSYIAEYNYFPGERQQTAVYNDAIQRYKYSSFWLAFIDIDEFIEPVNSESIPDFLRDFEDVPGVEINQVKYGSSGHEKKQDALVIERFKNHILIDNSSILMGGGEINR